MARGILPHEITDPDFQWLIKNYCESKGPVAVVDSGCLPLVMVLLDENARSVIPDALFNANMLGAVGAVDDVPATDGEKKS
jgi:hypothetical protein